VSLDFVRTGPSHVHHCRAFPFALVGLLFFGLMKTSGSYHSLLDINLIWSKFGPLCQWNKNLSVQFY